jgi:diguanylate cyclase
MINILNLVKLLLGGLFVGTVLVYALQANQQLASGLFLVPPLVATLSAMYAARLYHLSTPHGRAMSYFSIGLLSFLVGETLFYYYQFVAHTEPFPSVADIFYLAAYPFIFAGLVQEIRAHKPVWQSFNRLLLLLIGLLLSALSLIVAYFGVYLAYNGSESLAYNAISIGYGLADLMLIVPTLFILKMVLDYRGGQLFVSWMFMLFGLLWMLAGDVLFAIYESSYSALDWPYTMIDLAWVSSYLLFSLSFLHTASAIKRLHLKLKPSANELPK